MSEKMNANTAAKYARLPVVRGVIQMFPRAILELARVSAYGCKKHGVPINSTGFTTVPDAEGQMLDSLGRHLCHEAIEGLVNPTDGNLLHAAQAAWNALARLEILLKTEEDNEKKVREFLRKAM